MLRYAITDRRLACLSTENDDARACAELLARCAKMAGSNLDFLLIREKDLPAATLLPLTRAIVAAFHGSATRILVARRPDIAGAAGAHGVHLSASRGELTAAEVRTVFPAAFLSRSCHTLDEVRDAAGAQVDAILFGPVFAKTVAGREVTPGLGLAALQAAATAAGTTPALALGGVTPANAPRCIACGAAGIAGIRMFFAEQHLGS